MGSLTVLIGPNGFGKTYALEKTFMKDLLDKGVVEQEIFFMPAEIFLDDEVKDTDTSTSRSKTMEFLLTDLFELTEIERLKKELHDEYNNQINLSKSIVNSAFEKSANKNGMSGRSNFIAPSSKFSISKPISINAKDFKELIGSGQKYFFFLQLLENSKKKYVFLDEPEQYSHPSMQNDIANIINHLVEQDKEVYITTHSPKLLSMLNVDLNQIIIINDDSHIHKKIDLSMILKDLNKDLKGVIGSLKRVEKDMYDVLKIEEIIKTYYYREFLESLFTKKVYLVEGYSDELFVKKILKESGHYYEDYFIFRTNGKFKMPIFAKMFEKIGIEIRIYFDLDDEGIKSQHKSMNEFIRLNYPSKFYLFDENLEDELETGSGKNKLMSSEMIDFLNTWVYDNKFDIWN